MQREKRYAPDHLCKCVYELFLCVLVLTKMYILIYMCECVFSGQTRGAWTRCEFHTENLDLHIFNKSIFILLNFNRFTVIIPAVWAVHASMSRVSQVWWERKVTEGKEEKRLVQIAERNISLFSVKYNQIFIFHNVVVSSHHACVRLYIHPMLVKRNIARTSSGNFFKFATNVH